MTGGTRVGDHPPPAVRVSSTGAHRVWSWVADPAYRRRVTALPRPLAAALVVLLGAAALVLPTAAAPAAVARPAGVVVSPDPQHDLYVGTGGLVVPARDWRSGGGRAETAACAECRWRISRLCTKDEAAAGGCPRIRTGCPVGTIPVRIWLLRPGQDWAVVGEACQGDRPPVTVSDVGSAVRDRAEAALPPLRAAVQPASGTLVGVPAVFASGQPAAGIRGADLSVLGLAVSLDARARWHWTYGDGAQAWSTVPGGRWPDLSVSHSYRRAATVTVGVSAVWRGEFTVEGLGPFAVPGAPLVQDGSVPLVVREARARLVG